MKDNAKASWVTHPWVAQGQQRIRFGILQSFIPYRDWSQHRDWVQVVEGLGFDSYWVSDHTISYPDCWTTLSMLATSTKIIRLGSLVSCIYYRSPALLARVAADVDHLSNGRLVLGIGIGDWPDEFAQLGIPVPSIRERQQALEETVQIVRGLWREASFTYRGKYFAVDQASFRLGPIQQPHVPILIAGGGERVTLRQVVDYADVSNFGAHVMMGSAFGLDDVVRKFEVLRTHCVDVGRPYTSVLRSHLTLPLVLAETPEALQTKLDAVPKGWRTVLQSSTLAATPSEVIAHYQALVDAGVQYFRVGIIRHDLGTLQMLAQHVMPALTKT